MTIHPPVISVVGLGAAIMPLVSCGRCLQPPCPPPIAITIEVTAAATGSPISNAFLTVSGPTVSTGPLRPDLFRTRYRGNVYPRRGGPRI